MPRAILVDRCQTCPWAAWDYRGARFFCSEPRVGGRKDIPEPGKEHEVPDSCPLPRVELAVA